MTGILPIVTPAAAEVSHTWDISAAPLVSGGVAHVVHNGLAALPSTVDTSQPGAIVYTPEEPFGPGDSAWGWYDAAVPVIVPGSPVRAPIRDRVTARARLTAMCAPSVAPELTDADLDQLLDARQVASIWMPNTYYVVGNRVAPPVPNGRLYRCVANPYAGYGPEIGGGTSGLMPPAWQGVTHWPRLGLRGLADGTDGLFWAEDGPEGVGLWDLRSAAYDAWVAKAARASGDYATSAEGQSFHPEQVYRQCMDMAARYRPMRIA